MARGPTSPPFPEDHHLHENGNTLMHSSIPRHAFEGRACRARSVDACASAFDVEHHTPKRCKDMPANTFGPYVVPDAKHRDPYTYPGRGWFYSTTQAQAVTR